MAAGAAETLGWLCWPYKSLPTGVREAAQAEAKAELAAVLEDLRNSKATAELLSYALRRLERARDYGRDPLELHIPITLELWRLVQEPSVGYWLRRKCVGALQQKLRGLRKHFLASRGLRPLPEQVDDSIFAQLREVLSWRTIQSLMLDELERVQRGAPLEPQAAVQQLVESLAGLVNELRHWTSPGEAQEIAASMEKWMDPSERSVVLFGRLMLMALPTDASLQFIQDGRLARWWDLLPRLANSRFSLMWVALPARAAKVRWASGQPRPSEPILSQEALSGLLDIVAGTMCLPVDGGKVPEMDPYTEDCAWAFLGKTTYRLVAKFLVYSLEPLARPGEPLPEGSMWATVEKLCRRLAACTIHSGAWTWHVRTFLAEFCRGYYVRVCRERYREPGCLAHESFLMTPACDDTFVRLLFPLLVDMLTLQSGGHEQLQAGTTTAMGFVCRLALLCPARWEEVRPFVQEAVQDLADPMSVRQSGTLHLLTSITPLLVYAAPGLVLEAADLALPGVDPTDPMKTMLAAAFFVNLFVQLPTLDLSLKDMPDELPKVLDEVLPVLCKGAELVPGATPGDVQMVSSTMPDLCHNLLERFLEYVQAVPKPSKKDAMAALDLAGPRLISTALFLAAKQGEASMAERMVDRLAEWVSLTLLPNAKKAVAMLVGVFALLGPAACARLLDRAIAKLPLGGGGLAALGESEVLWHIHMLGAAARFGGPALPPRRAALEACFQAAIGDKRKAVRRAGAKLCRRVLMGLTAPYSGDLTGDGTVEEALHRWSGARSLKWGSPMRPIQFHTPTAEELAFAHALCERGVELVKAKAGGSDEDIHTALSLMKSLLRGVACLYPDERQGKEAVPVVSLLPNDWGPQLMTQFAEVLLTLCPRLASPGHPFDVVASEVSGRPNLLCKAMRMVVGLVRGERRPEIPDLFQIRGFEGGNVRGHVSSESATQKIHFMSGWRDLSRVWYNWEVLSLMNRRLHHRPTGFRYEGTRRQLAEMICGYTLHPNSMVSCVATECLQAYLKVHYGAKKALLYDCLLPLQEKTIRGASALDSEKAHIAEAALQGFARTAARLFVTGAWRRGAGPALKLASSVVRTVHAYTEEGKSSVDVRPVAISMQFELISKWGGAQAAANPGSAAEACEVAAPLLALLKQPGVHWRTKVCVLATAGPALRVLHLTAPAGELEHTVLRRWLAELLASVSGSGPPQMASVAVAELTTALRSAQRRPGLPLDQVLQELLPRDGPFLEQVAKTLSGLHQGHMGADAGAVAQADTVQCVVLAATGRLGVPHLAWGACPAGHAWTMHAAFFQTYVTFRTRRGDPTLIQELQDVLGALQRQPKSEAEDHVVFIEALAGVLRASRKWPAEQQAALWEALAPIAAEELRTAEEDNVRNWQFLVYYSLVGVSRRLRPRGAEGADDRGVLRLASFLAAPMAPSGADPSVLLAPVSSGEGEASSHVFATRLRLLQILLVALQRRTPSISLEARLKVLQGLLPALKEGVSHPYKQVHEESAKGLVLAMVLDVDHDLISDLKAWVRLRAEELRPAVPSAPKDSAVSSACEGLVYVFIHGLLARRLRALSLQCAGLLLAAASADDHELRALAGLALGCLGQSPHRELTALQLAQALTALCTSLEGEDVNSATRARRLEAAAALLGSSALRHSFALRMARDGEGGRLCRDALINLLGDKRVEVRIASQAALAPMLGLEGPEFCKKQAKTFATLGPDASVDRAVHGLGAMLAAAGSLGVPPWLGSVVEALSKVAKRPEAKKEVERTVQAFLKQQQQSRHLWKRCQTRLSESQMDLLKAGQGTMSYYS